MFKHGFPPEWSTFKKLIWLVGTGIAGAASAVWKTVTGALIHITDALASPMQKCEVTLEPIQSGSGDPSPTNVRPITGWTGCEVNADNNNLFDEVWELGAISNSTGQNVDTGNDTRVKNYIPVKGGRYFFLGWDTAQTGSVYGLVDVYKADKSFSRYFGAFTSPRSFTLNADEAYIRFYLYARTTPLVNAYIVYGTSSADYVPHQGTTASVTFPDSTGIVYGGTLDVVTGELVVNKVKVTLDGITHKVNSNYTRDNWIVGGWVYATPNGKSGIAQVLCDKLKVIDQYASYTTPYCLIPSDAGNLYFRILLTHDAEEQGVVDKATCLAYVNNWLQQNPVSIVYRLKEPITYQLTPQEISTLAGENNIWADCGDVEITYKAQAE